ncbi:alpha-methylacyl-CoA racemase isoform X2 [Cephus cinctus]|nr:alpha-methylacyl-CoA racemase isoform X2 [Cephus cinctus]XP_024945583.1 alpha-methylacyl-CoA racemase isoform X2 [Cephus cinctus]XP_024945584.1 alpha-methylacyl-CoA racemase isoform X2 [Cephus cinctus]
MPSIQTFDCLGNGKKSISIDLKTKKGADVLRKLCDQNDVLIDPFRKGVMEKLSLGPKELMNRNKRLIYARLTGFGQHGPYSTMAGHDINFLALSGLLSLFGRHGEKPTPPINLAADFGGGGLMCTLGIILALFERNQSNMGQIIDASMVEGSAYLGSWFYRSREIPGLWGQPRGKNLLDTGAHFYDTYQTKDGKYMSVGAIEPQFYNILLEKLELSDNEVPQFEKFEENRIKLAEKFKEKTQEEWCAIFDGTDACVIPVLSLEEAPHHSHNKHNESFLLQKQDSAVPKPAPRLSRSPGASCVMRGPHLIPGENSVEILKEYNFDSTEINDLISQNIIKQRKTQAKL